jgi:Kef-type K+ transport system membrane component KefB
MKIIFALLIIVFLAFSGYHLTFRGFKLPLFAREFYLKGTEFLFLGLVLGPSFLNLLDTETLKGLEPVGALVLGWIGLLFGFQFEITRLRRFPLDFFTAALLESLLTFAVVFWSVYLTLPMITDISGTMRLVVSLTLSAAAACTAQTGVALLTPDFTDRHGKTIGILRYMSSMDGLSALLIFGMVFFFRRSSISGFYWIGDLAMGTVFSLVISMGLVFLYIIFIASHRDEKELALVVIAMAVLTSGIASLLHFSPLVTNFFVGFCLVNFCRRKERLFKFFVGVEKPVYLLLLVFLGASWTLHSPWLIVLAALYCLCRFGGKLFGGFLVTRLNPELRSYPPHIGFGLLDQGGLPLAILFDFQRGISCDIAASVISLVLLAVIYNEFLGPYMLVRLLKEVK